MFMENEIWKDIPGYEGLYQASSLGRIKSLPKEWVNGDGAKQKHNGLILKAAITKKGYLDVSLRKNKVAKTFKVHRLVALAFIINPENKLQVNHKDGIKTNNNVNNLEWNTNSENQLHAHKIGLNKGPQGEKNHSSKLTKEQVLEIRSKYYPREYVCRKLAEEYLVPHQTIHKIVTKQTWKHI